MNMQLLEELCDVQGVAGYEDAVQEIVVRELLTCCDEVNQDRIGNIIGIKRANQPVATDRPLRVMFCAHCDECGFTVREVTDKGYIRLRGISGPATQAVTGKQIRISGTETVYGVIVPVDANSQTLPKIEDMLVYTGCEPSWVKERVSVGDRGTFDVALSHLNNSVISGRNFDDRLGVFCMIEAMKGISDLSVDIYAVSSVQEEIGTRGAMVASNVIKPDIGIALDGGCIESPMHSASEGWTARVGDGVALYRADLATVCSESLNTFLKELAEQNEIPCHDNWHGCTDASQMQKQGNGAYVTTIGAPTGFMHWPHAIADTRDLQAVTDLLKVFAGKAHEAGMHPEPWTALHE